MKAFLAILLIAVTAGAQEISMRAAVAQFRMGAVSSPNTWFFMDDFLQTPTGRVMTVEQLDVRTNDAAFLNWYRTTPDYLDAASGETNSPTLNMSRNDARLLKQRLAANLAAWQAATTMAQIRSAGTNTVNIMRRMLGE